MSAGGRQAFGVGYPGAAGPFDEEGAGAKMEAPGYPIKPARGTLLGEFRAKVEALGEVYCKGPNPDQSWRGTAEVELIATPICASSPSIERLDVTAS